MNQCERQFLSRSKIGFLTANSTQVNSYIDEASNILQNVNILVHDIFKLMLKLINRELGLNRYEFRNALLATAVGFLVMSVLGFIIKLLHMPISKIIMG